MKSLDKLISRFNDIQDLPVSEEMLGAYAEGILNASDSQKIVAAFSDLVGMEDFLTSIGDLSTKRSLTQTVLIYLISHPV